MYNYTSELHDVKTQLELHHVSLVQDLFRWFH